jgi:hypothetical protein
LTTGFKPATFDHAGIVDNCESCHDGVFARGKTATHPATAQDCHVCHNTTSFADVAAFDHTGVVDGCSDCHGVTATGKTPDHLPTDLDCHFCHTTGTFKGGKWDHQGITGNCESCHNGTSATGKLNGHFVTTEDCNVCHSTQGWAPINFKHRAGSDYPGDHNTRLALTCTSCHKNNNQNITYPSPTYAPSCAACHANKYKSGDHGGKSVATNQNCGQSRCHSVSSRSF